MNPLHKRMLTGLLAINIVGLISAVIAQDFSKRPFDYAKAYYRIVRGSSVYVSGAKVEIPSKCYILSKQVDGAECTLLCQDTSQDWTSINIWIFPEEAVTRIAASREPWATIHKYNENIWLEFEDRGSGRSRYFHIRTSDGLAVTGDSKELTKQFFDHLSETVPIQPNSAAAPSVDR